MKKGGSYEKDTHHSEPQSHRRTLRFPRALNKWYKALDIYLALGPEIIIKIFPSLERLMSTLDLRVLGLYFLINLIRLFMTCSRHVYELNQLEIRNVLARISASEQSRPGCGFMNWFVFLNGRKI